MSGRLRCLRNAGVFGSAHATLPGRVERACLQLSVRADSPAQSLTAAVAKASAAAAAATVAAAVVMQLNMVDSCAL